MLGNLSRTSFLSNFIPSTVNIHDKLRQQLQSVRDTGVLLRCIVKAGFAKLGKIAEQIQPFAGHDVLMGLKKVRARRKLQP